MESFDKVANSDDETDASSYGTTRGHYTRRLYTSFSNALREQGVTSTPRDSEFYYMYGPRRGDCHIFVYETFWNPRIPRRDSAPEDTHICKEAFESLGFTTLVHKNLKTHALRSKLKEVSGKNHSGSDAFAVVFMSHGDLDETDRECLFTYDGSIPTTDLWEHFTGDVCPSLAGKPKLFFIQACRGNKKDYGVGLQVMTDSVSEEKTQPYVVPACADILVMWASYSGMFAFKSNNSGIRGSVFIHFLAKALQTDGHNEDLATILLQVTRRVALDYESYCPEKDMHQNKQVPQIHSTLLRKVFFPPMLK